MIAEELAYGCTGMMTALEGSGLGVRYIKIVLKNSASSVLLPIKCGGVIKRENFTMLLSDKVFPVLVRFKERLYNPTLLTKYNKPVYLFLWYLD